jgi:hypothetical protein
MVRIVEDLVGDWSHLDERIENVTDEIEALARDDASCRQLMTVPGVGPIIASAMVAAIGNGTAFAKGRDFAAWLGLVPKHGCLCSLRAQFWHLMGSAGCGAARLKSQSDEGSAACYRIGAIIHSLCRPAFCGR